jgi:hypothetical protein
MRADMWLRDSYFCVRGCDGVSSFHCRFRMNARCRLRRVLVIESNTYLSLGLNGGSSDKRRLVRSHAHEPTKAQSSVRVRRRAAQDPSVNFDVFAIYKTRSNRSLDCRPTFVWFAPSHRQDIPRKIDLFSSLRGHKFPLFSPYDLIVEIWSTVLTRTIELFNRSRLVAPLTLRRRQGQPGGADDNSRSMVEQFPGRQSLVVRSTAKGNSAFVLVELVSARTWSENVCSAVSKSKEGSVMAHATLEPRKYCK